MNTNTKYILIIILSFLLVTACDNSSQNNKPIPNELLIGKLHRDSPLFIYSYGQDFAKRFQLSEEKAIELDPGLAAIAFEVRPEIGQIDCYIHLYLDDSVHVYVPRNQINYSKQGIEERIFAKYFNKEDAKLRASFDDLNRIVYRSKSAAQGLTGFVSTPRYVQIKSNFLPGLSLLTVEQNCSFLDYKNAPTEILIQKAGTGTYVLGNDNSKNMYNDKTYSFSIPPKLQRYFQPYIEYSIEFNSKENSSISFNPPKPTIEFP
ncbi:MAG: hypothetical protein L3J70_02785 [Gammaproteobacteria bacterium]|nr:hypothetical protein [Gammaproteobacteria bacterium]